jgi:CPA2 family monovalent cation:H+ antiporter-2
LPFETLRKDHEMQVFAAFVACFGLALLTGLLGLSAALGAFVAGILVTAARETQWVHLSLGPFRVVLVAVFFVSIGMLLDLVFLREHWITVCLLVAVTFLANTFINAIAFRSLGRNWNQSLYGGALLSQIGEFSFVLAAVGLEADLIAYTGYQITLAVIFLTLLLSPGWIALVKTLTTLASSDKSL